MPLEIITANTSMILMGVLWAIPFWHSNKHFFELFDKSLENSIVIFFCNFLGNYYWNSFDHSSGNFFSNFFKDGNPFGSSFSNSLRNFFGNIFEMFSGSSFATPLEIPLFLCLGIHMAIPLRYFMAYFFGMPLTFFFKFCQHFPWNCLDYLWILLRHLRGYFL